MTKTFVLSPPAISRWLFTTAYLAGMLIQADGATAAVSLSRDDRRLDLEAQGNSDFGGDTQQSFYDPQINGSGEFTPFSAADALNSTGAQSAVAQASGFLNSPLQTANLISGSGAVSGSATVLDETGQNAFAGGASTLMIGFSIDAPTTFRLSGELEATGAAFATAVLRTGFFPAGAILLLLDHGTAPSFNQLVTLDPGDYTIAFQASLGAQVFTGSSSGSASFNGSLTVAAVPELPGALATPLTLAAAAGALTVAPRRVRAMFLGAGR